MTYIIIFLLLPGCTDAARKYARRRINEHRTWSNYTFLSALSDKRHEDEKEALVDEIFHRYENMLYETNHKIRFSHTQHKDLLIMKK